jgi:hypothetical protein
LGRSNTRVPVARALGAVVLAALLAGAVLARAVAQSADVWSAVIPEAYPFDVYIWQLKPDGTYAEVGRDAATGRSIQETLTGRWHIDGARMILQQVTIGFVFDGIVRGDRYTGTLYLSGARVSRFCAARGDAPPRRCEPEDVVALHP